MNSFENWLETNQSNLNRDVYGLFKDSLRCFKNDIIRPAYLLAYQGMLLALREKILLGKMPEGFVEQEWRKICKEITDDGSWDEKTYDRVVQKAKDDGTKPAILNMSPFIREQFQYWRKLRNVCAHYKDFDFIPAHVLTLYSFIVSYLMKISVEGGATSLLVEFKEYCDPSKYSPITSLNPLISKISDMVDKGEMEDFINSVVIVVAKSHNRDYNAFLKTLLFLDGANNESVRNSTLVYIKSDIERRNRFIEANPELVRYILETPVEIREYWKKFLKYSQHPYRIVNSLLENGLLPADEIEELFYLLLDEGYKSNRALLYIGEKELEVLRRYGYFEIFLKSYFDESYIKRRYEDICYKTNFYMAHLFHLEKDVAFVRKIVKLFSELPFPYTLRDRIRDELWTAEPFKSHFEKIVKENEIIIPADFLQ